MAEPDTQNIIIYGKKFIRAFILNKDESVFITEDNRIGKEEGYTYVVVKSMLKNDFGSTGEEIMFAGRCGRRKEWIFPEYTVETGVYLPI